MTTNQKPNGLVNSIPAGLAIGWIAEMLAMILFCIVLTGLVLTDKMERENIGYGAMATLLISSYIGAVVSCRAIKHRNLLVCVLAGGIFLITLFGITILFFGGQYQAVGETSLLILAGSAAAALMNTAKKNGKKYGRKKRIL